LGGGRSEQAFFVKSSLMRGESIDKKSIFGNIESKRIGVERVFWNHPETRPLALS